MEIKALCYYSFQQGLKHQRKRSVRCFAPLESGRAGLRWISSQCLGLCPHLFPSCCSRCCQPRDAGGRCSSGELQAGQPGDAEGCQGAVRPPSDTSPILQPCLYLAAAHIASYTFVTRISHCQCVFAGPEKIFGQTGVGFMLVCSGCPARTWPRH